MQRILLLGRRAGAEQAVARMGLEPVVLAAPRRAKQARGAYGASAEESIQLAKAALDGVRPAAVVAVAEGAAPAAAHLRAHFDLPGLGFDAAMRCNDKLLMKRAVVAAGVPCARAVEVDAHTDASALIAALGLPVVLKLPVSSGGRGVRVCHTAAEIDEVLAPGLLAESFTRGVEMSVETLSARGRVLFRNHTRYLVPRWANIVPADLPAPELERIDRVVDDALAALGVDDGITHMELFVSEDRVVFGEVAARPPGGRLMELIELAYGFDPWQAMVAVALGDVPMLPARPRQFAGVWFLHPGPGRVAAVRGVDEARACPGVVHARVRVGSGDDTAVRVGSGQNVGEVVVVAPTAAECEARLRRAHGAIDIELSEINAC